MAENDLQANISKLLEDPEALSRIMGVASTLMGNMQSQEKNVPDVKEKESTEPNKATEQSLPFDLSVLPTILGAGTSSAGNDPKCALLSALKPYMGHGRADKIEKLIKALKMSELAGGFIKTGGMFK